MSSKQRNPGLSASSSLSCLVNLGLVTITIIALSQQISCYHINGLIKHETDLDSTYTEIFEHQEETVFNITTRQALNRVKLPLHMLRPIEQCKERNESVIKIGFLPNLSLVSNPIGEGLVVSGALSYAMSRINNDPTKLKGKRLELLFNSTNGDPLIGTSSILHQWQQGAAVFFGPEESCDAEANIATAINLPMISYKCQDAKLSNKDYYKTFIRTSPPATQIVNSVIQVIKFYNWTRVSLVTEKSRTYQGVQATLTEKLSEHNLTINTQNIFENEHDCCQNTPDSCINCKGQLINLVRTTYERTRIYIFIGPRHELHNFMHVLHIRNLISTGEYAIIYLDVDQDEYDEGQSYYYFLGNDGDPKTRQILKETAQYLLVLVTKKTPKKDNEGFHDQVRLYNQKAPFKFPTLEGLKKFIPVYATYLYDAFNMYIETVSEILMENGNIYNGEAVIQRIITKRRYKSIAGHEIHVDENGDVEGNYTILAYVPSPSTIEFKKPASLGNITHTMYPIGNFYRISGTKTIAINMTGRWLDGLTIPLDKPKCGYDGLLCDTDATQLTKSKITLILLAVYLSVFLVIFHIYRSWKSSLKLTGLLWKIDLHQLKSIEYINKPLIRAPSRVSIGTIESSNSTGFRIDNADRSYTDTATYKGMRVALSEITVNAKKHSQIPADTQQELKTLKEIRHENIVQFIGAALVPHTDKLCYVSEYCGKGSLKDVLSNRNSRLDLMFVSSLIFDLLYGLDYLHNSELRLHGNLKASNCLVTSRWTLKLSDFGLARYRENPATLLSSRPRNDEIMLTHPPNSIVVDLTPLLEPTEPAPSTEPTQSAPPTEPDSQNDDPSSQNLTLDDDYYRSLVYHAPERLREPWEELTQMEDIYAFGVIFHEMITNEGPFGLVLFKRPVKEAIDLVVNPNKQEIRRLQAEMRVEVEKLRELGKLQNFMYQGIELMPDRCDNSEPPRDSTQNVTSSGPNQEQGSHTIAITSGPSREPVNSLPDSPKSQDECYELEIIRKHKVTIPDINPTMIPNTSKDIIEFQADNEVITIHETFEPNTEDIPAQGLQDEQQQPLLNNSQKEPELERGQKKAKGSTSSNQIDCDNLFRPLLDHVIIPKKNYIKCLIRDCWDEEPGNRPPIRTIKRRLHNFRPPGGRNNIMDNLVTMLERHNATLEFRVCERTAELSEEKKKSEMLLYRMLPPSVANELMHGENVTAEMFDSVTIFFSDIVGFTEMSSRSTPMQVVAFLNDLYTVFDNILKNYNVYKVETIGDAYMVVSGVPKRIDHHACEIASMAIELMNSTRTFKIRHLPDETLQVRIGLHSGPVAAGVVGHMMPRYCLFGDTVNTASRLESTGEAYKIHASETTKNLLVKNGNYMLEDRGDIELKGKGRTRTFWVLGHVNEADRCGYHNNLNPEKRDRKTAFKQVRGGSESSVATEGQASSRGGSN